jgi:hypothetical protein
MTYPWAAGEVLTAADLNAYAGLVLVKTQSIGTSVSSVTVTSAFSSTYDNYRIVGHFNSASTNATGDLQLGVGTTMTTTGYYWGHVNVTTAGTLGGSGGSNDTKMAEITVIAVNGASFVIDITSPNLARRTGMTSAGSDMRTGGSPFRYTGAYAENTTQFTSFALLIRTGNFTGGTIRVYGYNNG